jgi:HTH-type transcriptional regulator, sugar sensing transcriptional regulator
MEDLKKELEHLGLSEKEASVYLAALEMGPSPVQDISHKSKVNRATTYVMIESLAGRGLMSTFQKGKKRFYAAESPDRLMSIIEAQQKTLKEKQIELETALPMLSALYNAEGAKPQVRYLEGPEGGHATRQIFERLKGDFVQVVPLDDVHALEDMLHGRDEHIDNIIKQGVAGKVMFITEDQKAMSKLPKTDKIDYQFIHPTDFPLHGEMAVRGNHVFLFSHKSALVSVVIVSQEIADLMRSIFDMAWRLKKEPNGSA